MKNKRILCVCGAIVWPHFALSQQLNQETAQVSALDLSSLTVTATRTEKELSEVASSVTVIEAEDIERKGHRDIADLVRYEPGVLVTGSGRFGLDGFNIRGIGGDRILTLIDGVPVADEFTFGPNLSARRNFIDVDTLKAVEIVRGPASSLYGSNAIGGLVTFISKTPFDYIRGSEGDHYGSYKFGFDSANDSIHNTLSWATGNVDRAVMVVASHRSGEENSSYFNDTSSGPARRAPNPQRFHDNSLYAQAVFNLNDESSLRLSADLFDGQTQTEVLSEAGTVVFGDLKQSVQGDDSRERKQFSVSYDWQRPWLLADEQKFSLYHQQSDSEQITLENRLTADALAVLRHRGSYFSQDNTGFKWQAVKSIDSAVSQQWVYGLDLDWAKSETLRTGQTLAVSDGSLQPEGSVFPTRDFPNSDYRSQGVFVHNELGFFDGRLTLTPGLRYDRFKLEPSADDVYLSGNEGSPLPAGYDESNLSGRLSALWRASDRWSLFAQYAEGFRAPPIDAVNAGFTNFAGGYIALPNPDLRPEKSSSLELGLRYMGEHHWFELSLYDNRYDDFIETLAFAGFNPMTGLLEFKSRNLSETEISGLELRGQFDLSSWRPGLALHYAYANSDGEDSETGAPLNSIQPETLVTGLVYDDPMQNWGLELAWTLTARKDDIDASALAGTAAFEAPGSGVLDVLGHYRFNDHFKVQWGVFNLNNKLHWQWNNVLLTATGSASLARLSQPGRNASVTLKFEF